MTIAAQTAADNRTSAAGNGVTTSFSFPKPFTAQADLVVQLVLIASPYTATTQTLTTHYTISGTADAQGRYGSGANVVFLSAPSALYNVVIYADPSVAQGLDLVENDPLPAEQLELAYDKLTLLTRRVRDLLARAFKLPDSSVSTGTVTLEPVASKVIGFDASKNLTTYDASSAVTSGANVTVTQSGTGALSETVQDVLRKGFVYADSYSGASVTAKIDAAIAAAAGRVVIIPPTMGVGEPTTVAVGQGIIDMRAATVLSGKKIVYNGSDSNGYVRFLVLDDQTSPTLSNAAVLFSHRATGTLPDNRNGEGGQFVAATTGALLNSPTGYILSGIEVGASVYSTGGTLPFVWGGHSTAATETGSTTAVTQLATWYFTAPAKRGSGVIANAYTIVVEDPGAIASTDNYSIWSKGAVKLGGNVTIAGDIALNRIGVSSGSSFISGGLTNYYYLDIGNSASRLRFAVAGNANDFLSGCAQSDGMLFTVGNTSLWLGVNQAPIVQLTSAGMFVTGIADINGTAASGTAGHLKLGSSTQSTIGANGAASALTANPLGYLVAYVGTTKVIIPYYNS